MEDTILRRSAGRQSTNNLPPIKVDQPKSKNGKEYHIKIEAPRTKVVVTKAPRGISSESWNLFESYKRILFGRETNISDGKVKVGSSLSGLAFYYERFRNSIDYREDQTQLRNSIERISKRLLWENPSRAINTQVLAESLVKELIWAKYLKNDAIPRGNLTKISYVYEKYLALLSSIPISRHKIDHSITWRDWVFGMCAGEIEEVLLPVLTRYDVLAESVTNWFFARYNWNDPGLSPSMKKVYVWAAAYRSLVKTDLQGVRYHLLKRFLPSWISVGKEDIEEEKLDLMAYAKMIEKCLYSDTHARLYRFLQKHTPAFLVLADIAEEEDGEAVLTDNQSLVNRIREICNKKYDEIGGRVATGITRSIIYIFVTKVIFAILLEVPYEIWVLHGIRYLPIAINITLPPFMMLLIGLMIKKPGPGNTRKIIEKINDFVYGTGGEKVNFSLIKRKQAGIAAQTFGAFYGVFFMVIFGLITWGLYKLHFSIVSAGIFYMFLSLVLLFGFRVRHSASELNVSSDEEGFWPNLLSTISLPFLNLGSFLSKGLSKLNVLVVVLDFLIEAPLKNILALLEDWNIFMKEKKEEIIEVPNA